MARRIGPILLVLAVLLAQDALSQANSQAKEQDAAKPLQYDVSVTLKLIQVYVTDKSGKPVMDLAKEDFRLNDSGRPVTITAFEKHGLAAATDRTESPSPNPAPASTAEAAPSLSRKFIILFDLAFNTAHGVVASVDAAKLFLDTQVRDTDELAFFSYSALRGLKIHEFLTTDHAKVKAALAAITSKDIAGRADEVEQAYWMTANNSGEPKFVTREEAAQQSSLDLQRRDSMLQAEKYFGDLTRLAQALRLVQGQKSILFFSTGVPSSLINMSRNVGTDQNINNTGSASFKSTGTVWQVANSVLSPLQEKLLREFSASNCSLYAFDTRDSSKLPALFSYDEMAFLNRPSGGLLGADTGGIFRDDKTTGMDSLRRLAKETGGKYYANILRREQNLEEVSAVTGAYYVLGYPIPAAFDGQFHDIKIEVARKGCQVRTQPGYYNPKPFRDFSDIEKDIHLFDLALNERAEFQTPKALSISALIYDAGQGPRVRLLSRVPPTIWGAFTGQNAEIVALFFDAQDDLISLQRLPVSRAEFGQKDVVFTASAAARPGANKCRVVMRDLDTGQSAVAARAAFCPNTGGRSLAVFSPLMLVAGGSGFRLEGVVKGTVENPSWREVYPYDPAEMSPVLGGEDVKTGAVELIVPYSAPGLGPENLVFKVNLVNSASAANLALPVRLGESTKPGTLGAQKLTISLEDVPNGHYLLYVHVGSKVTGQVASAQVPLTVAR